MRACLLRLPIAGSKRLVIVAFLEMVIYFSHVAKKVVYAAQTDYNNKAFSIVVSPLQQNTLSFSVCFSCYFRNSMYTVWKTVLHSR